MKFDLFNYNISIDKNTSFHTKQNLINVIPLIKDQCKINGMYDEDLFQDMFLLSLEKALPNYDPDKGTKFTTYLTTILKHERYSRYGKKENISLNKKVGDDELQSLIADISDPDSKIIADIISIIEKFNYKYRYTLTRYYNLEGQVKTAEEIADYFNCSVQTVYTILNKGIELIKNKLKWEGYEV